MFQKTMEQKERRSFRGKILNCRTLLWIKICSNYGTKILENVTVFSFYKFLIFWRVAIEILSYIRLFKSKKASAMKFMVMKKTLVQLLIAFSEVFIVNGGA